MFTLERVVPWGRSFDEYCRMFALTGADLGSRILGCADGPASFNAEAARRGCRVVSCDPLYRYPAADVARRIDETTDRIVAETQRNQRNFVWTEFGSVDDLRDRRLAAMRRFLDDFESGRVAGRYVDAELPALPFDDGAFDLALCSHFLFLYSEQLTAPFHVAAVRELLRVAAEARIFPLLGLDVQRSPHVDAVVRELEADGALVSIERVPYEFQRGGNEMLRLRRAAAGSAS
jgi:hypothetical protein